MNKKFVKRLLKRAVVFAVVAYIWWPLAVIFLLTGFYDVIRQKSQDKAGLFQRYFFGNGTLTWLFSPLNTLVDIICLPFVNKQIYRLEDLPQEHQQEIQDIIQNCPSDELIAAVENLKNTTDRTMLLYKWYGFNVPNKYPAPLLHKKFSRVLTIGVSTFSPQTQTSKHFGWLRAGVRVLINIDKEIDDGAYIVVNDKRHTWSKDGLVFIFDDTVLHQSFNLTDNKRHCLFIDVTRPSLVPGVINGFIKTLGWLSINLPFLKNKSSWKVEH